MKKGTQYIGNVIRVDFPNKGVLQIEDEKVSVKNTLPGQKICFVVSKARKGKSEGRLVEVLEKSPLETEEPRCIHFGSCGGCACQTIPDKVQLEIKADQVKRLLDTVCTDYRFDGIKGSPLQWGYRNKMEFSFGDEVKDGPLSLGLHKKGSFYDIITTSQCQIVDLDYNQILACVLDYFTELGMTFYKKLSHVGYLRHLLIRKAAKTGEILVDLITSTQWKHNGSEAQNLKNKNTVSGNTDIGNTVSENLEEEGLKHQDSEEKEKDLKLENLKGGDLKGENSKDGDLEDKNSLGENLTGKRLKAENTETEESEVEAMEEFRKRLLNLKLAGSIVGILHTYNDSQADIVQSERTDILYGQDYFYEELLGLKFKISTFSFFQTNSLGAEVLYSTVREFIGETKDRLIFDLYSGTGTIAQLLAPVAKKVIGVEIVEEAVITARKNAALNGLDNCKFIVGDVLKVIDGIEDKPDLIVLDPPRDGIHPKALEKIIDFGVDRIVYISCKPTSLARDLIILQERGYQVKRVCCVDMFPNTGHVEVIIMMTYCGQKGK